MKDSITLMGYPTGSLRKIKPGIYSFDLVTSEGFSAIRKKSFPKEEITYTIFMHNSIRLPAKLWMNTDITQLKVKVWGTPTLDFPVTECPGDIGVICHRIVVLQNTESVPEETDDMIPFDSILISFSSVVFTPSPGKLNAVISFYREHGHFDIPIRVTKELKILQDGYAQLYAAKMMNIENVPVKYVDSYDDLNDINS